MLYATKIDETTILCAAADDVRELNIFAEDESYHSIHHYTVDEPDIMSRVQNYRNFKSPLYLFSFINEQDMETFSTGSHITMLNIGQLADKQSKMIENSSDGSASTTDSRPIGEIHDIMVNDPWDKRTPEEKLADQERSEKKRKQMADKTAGDFGQMTAGVRIKLSQLHAKKDLDDIFKIEGTGHVKDSTERLDALEKMRANNEDMFMVRVNRASYVDLMVILIDEPRSADIRSVMAENNKEENIAWIVYKNREDAETVTNILIERDYSICLVKINNEEEELLIDNRKQELIAVVEKIRPWNDKERWDAATEEELAAYKKEIRPNEFIFAGTYSKSKQECWFYIVPETWFREYEDFYTESLDIDHMLPSGMKEVEPGVYSTKNTNLTQLLARFGDAGFKEDMLLQIHLNNNGY